MNNGLITENAAKRGGGVNVHHSEFTMNGGTISKNSANEEGGGVYCQGVWNQSEDIFPYIGTFIMKGGTISENTAQMKGGGVFVWSGTIPSPSGGRFIMEGGSIINNKSGFWGGGLFCDGISSMSGGIIDGNTAEIEGGGVYVSLIGGQSLFTKNGGGTITGEYAPNGNRTLRSPNYPGDKLGHAVYAFGSGLMDNTVDPSHNLDSSKVGPAGGWDFLAN